MLTQTVTPRRRRSALIPVIVAIDALLILFPPFHWWFANGNLPLALTYVIGVPALLGLSLPMLDWASRSGSESRAEGRERS